MIDPRIPKNEIVLTYMPGSRERAALLSELEKQSKVVVNIPLIINGEEIHTSTQTAVVMPHDHRHVLAMVSQASAQEVGRAIEAAMTAKNQWMSMSRQQRGAILLKAADLIATKYRHQINAATMLGQGKNIFQSEIDAICETVDFIRFNEYFASFICQQQPLSNEEASNSLEYRPLEGFIYCVSPFNFTAIASNLCLAPVMMGNTVIWKPAQTAALSNYYLVKIFEEAGLPKGVLNFVPGDGAVISEQVFTSHSFSGLHFTGSTKTFRALWKQIANNLDHYITYPKLVGETGGKDFVFAHPSANIYQLATALVRGAFEYQGQKCSAASRAYIPASIWTELSQLLLTSLQEITIGHVNNPDHFMNAVINEKAFDRIMRYIGKAKDSADATILTGGQGSKEQGYFIEPTVILTADPHFITMQEEIFGPVLTIYVYEDERFDDMLSICNNTSPYALTGAIFATDTKVIEKAKEALKYAAGNFYVNDKPTGAMVGLQPFGGARASGTNDKAGSYLNLLRWVSPRNIKQTHNAPTDYRYPYMGPRTVE